MQAMIRTKEFEKWKPRAAATLVATPGEVIPGEATLGTADIQVAGGIQEAAIPVVDIPGAATLAVILEAILAGAKVIHTQGVEAEDPTGEEELPRRTLKVTRKCSR
jgi:hypothetical protein